MATINKVLGCARSESGMERLLPELEPFVHDERGGMWVHHPLIIERVFDLNKCANINDRYRNKREDVRRALQNKDWEKYIFLHERPYRLRPLLKARDRGLVGTDYWKLLGWVWQDSENIYQHRRHWRCLWSAADPDRSAAMTSEEQAQLATLPDTFTVYRGTQHPQTRQPLSWTLDRKIAVRFANRYSTDGYLLTGTTRKTDARALFQGREESEIVSLKVKVTSNEPVPTELSSSN